MNPISPKLPNILTGRERYRDAAAVAAARTALGLGTMATQNSNAVNITGGAITNLSNITSTNCTITNINGTTGAFSSSLTTAISSATNRFMGLAASFGNLSVAPFSAMDCQSTTGLQAEIITTSGTTLSGAYTNILLDGTDSGVCTGSITEPTCSNYTDSATCTANGGHGGCAWNAYPCEIFNGDETGCNDNSGNGCAWETVSCSDNDNTDQTACESNAGCVWNDPLCEGTYATGNCVAAGSCTGTAACANIGAEGQCNAEAGCAWGAGLEVMLPDLVDDRFYFLKDIAAAATVNIIPYDVGVPAQTIEGGASLTLNPADALAIVGKSRTASCAAITDEVECDATSGCAWEGVGGVCEGFYVAAKNWYIMSSHGV